MREKKLCEKIFRPGQMRYLFSKELKKKDIKAVQLNSRDFPSLFFASLNNCCVLILDKT